MGTPNHVVARLDMAARAVTSETFIVRNRRWFLVINLLLVALAFASNRRFGNPLVAPTFAVCAVFATMILWSNWQYKLYVPAIFLFAIALVCVLLGKNLDTTFDRICFGIWLGMYGSVFWMQAGPFATVNGPGWEKEQSQVNAWWGMLSAPQREGEVIEFSTGSFWTGFHTYRLISPGPYWAVVRFWRGAARVLSNYRIREIGAVTFITLSTGEVMVRIGDRTMRAVNVSMPISGSPTDPALPKSA